MEKPTLVLCTVRRKFRKLRIKDVDIFIQELCEAAPQVLRSGMITMTVNGYKVLERVQRRATKLLTRLKRTKKLLGKIADIAVDHSGKATMEGISHRDVQADDWEEEHRRWTVFFQVGGKWL